MNEQLPTTQDILDAINGFAEDVQIKFEKIDERFDKIDERLNKHDDRFTKIESGMVTKEYLDDKIADLRGDLIEIDKKTDNKIDFVVGKLNTKKVFNKNESEEIISMSPFPKLN